jgi:hypothetical protein
MIPNPGAYIKQYVAQHYPEIDYRKARITEIGASAHVDVWLTSNKKVSRLRLMLPHTAPAHPVPLLAEVHVGARLLWNYHEEAHYWDGNRVHLHVFQNRYFMLYVKPDRDQDWLTRIRALDDLFRGKTILSAEAELTARFLTAQRLGYRCQLNQQERKRVRKMTQILSRAA